ncbi:response regulator [Leptolyngbya sp. 7M]|nr:response regulator [Leptolyngbya sp. 7M]
MGRIEIQANQHGNQTVIEVKDDGQGIDLQRVVQRAIELQLITAEQASTIPESQLLDLLFQPGFSTASQVSDLSGRGIGLNVVKNQLQTINGSVTISTSRQQGTTFTLKIPLSLTTTKLLVCQAQGLAYALPVERVEQIIVPNPSQISVIGGEQLVMHWQREAELMVPLYSLSELVHYSENSFQLYTQTHSKFLSATSVQPKKTDRFEMSPVLLLQTIYGYRGLMVDRVLGEQELVIRSFGSAIAPPPYVYGCCILSNSRSALAIDVEVLMQLTTEVESLPEYALPAGVSAVSRYSLALTSGRRVFAEVNQAPSLQPARSATILIVDDSLTLRHDLIRLFQQVGYTIHQAENGLEALALLRQQPGINLVICDLEMPRLNGFEFLSQVQQDPALAPIPVVVLTSRNSAKHRQLALTLGANRTRTRIVRGDISQSIRRESGESRKGCTRKRTNPS